VEEAETIRLVDVGASRGDLTQQNTEDIHIVIDGNRLTA